MVIASTIFLHESGLRLFFKTAKAASIWLSLFLAFVFVAAGVFAVVAFFVRAGCFLAAGFFAEVFLSAAVLVAVVVFVVLTFVFTSLGFRGSALATVANGTTQLPLSRKHIQRCPGVIPRTYLCADKRWPNSKRNACDKAAQRRRRGRVGWLGR
ncbi:hypothetical protein [Rhodopirellula europaea]|uniref:hypothetical protein n=1 Tax=Rhodopirellula europaea TaxID=1263866 RepID=UPI003D2AA385